MKKSTPVKEIMTKKVHTVQYDESLDDALEIITKHKVRHVPVLKGKQLVGIISKTDLNRLTFSGLFDGEADPDDAVLDMLTIRQVMSHKPRVVKDNTPIKEVALTLSKEEFHALPVVSEKDESKLVGIVTTTDVIKYMLAELK